MESQTRLMVLEKGVRDHKSVYRLKKGWRLRFACSPLLQSENVRLFWNYHTISSTQTNHDHYEELKWQKNDLLSEGYDFITEERIIDVAGAYHFFYTIDGSMVEEKCDGYGYFIIDPHLTVDKDDKTLEMDAVQLQTILPKLLGPFPEWKERLLVSYKSGYNMIHFAPIQRLNCESHSSYSLSDQLELNPAFSTQNFACSLDNIRELVKFMKEEWSILSITDMVYNHTANDSSWLSAHPESAYNLNNSPHLKPAYLVDRLVYYTSQKVASHELENQGVPARLNHNNINALREYMKREIQTLNIQEFFTVEIEDAVNCFTAALQEVITTLSKDSMINNVPELEPKSGISIVQDTRYRRNGSTIDVKEALLLYTDIIIKISKSKKSADVVLFSEIVVDFRERVLSLNQQKTEEIQRHLDAAVENVIQGAMYRFINDDGPKIPQVTTSEQLVHLYFINKMSGYLPGNMQEDSAMIEDEHKCRYIMAHNGWVFGDDPLKNFAEPGSVVYLKRELVAWGDSVKLRYGNCPADSPYLWQRMETYTKQSVEIFHGIRLDNCHSTPIHVAEHMMRYARKIRPDLYVMAELFTSHEDIDNLFVNRLGLNSLIREGLSAWDAHEQGRLVYRYGGKPVGSFVQPNVQLLKPAVAHAIFMDATHDNESIIDKRTVYDSLSLSAYIAMSCCATGSNRGYDELIPHHISVVNETRLYASWSDQDKVTPTAGVCNINTGIISAKLALNRIHQCMGEDGFDQVYVHDLSGDVVSITRHNPITHNSYICVVRSAFSSDGNPHPHADNLNFEGAISEVAFYGHVRRVEDVEFSKHQQFLHGLTSHSVYMQANTSISSIPGVSWKRSSDNMQTISFHHFPPGTVLIIRVAPNHGLVSAQSQVLKHTYAMHEYVAGKGQLSTIAQDIKAMMSKLTLSDLNAAMYHCEAEEKSINGFGSYNIPQYGSLVYTGLQGILSPMSKIRTNNDLGHPICQNIRDGDWLLEYISGRMSVHKPLKQLASYISELLGHVALLPRYLIPCYFDVVLIALSMIINQTVWNKMNKFVSGGSPFIRELALCSQQFCGNIESAKLARLASSLETSYKHPTTGELDIVSISAGLPHFSEGLMRIWGRDTFIALRGLLLVTGRFNDARAIILSFAGTLRHGLIPNLHGEGVHARYNCRDAVWWWLQSIQDYCNMASDGYGILADDVLRIYPTDDSDSYERYQVQPLMEVVQEALQRHADGIKFRERNAGNSIDEHMSDEGFNVTAGIDWNTGFVYGGNAFNCGTWMDKMGSSEKAGNKGKPATPRDGSAVELVGLCASAVRWLSELSAKGLYPHKGVAAQRDGWSHKQLVTFDVWYNLIKRNFEPCFFVDGTYSSLEKDPNPQLINRRNIYKDSYKASHDYADYQLRPNFPIAMVVAPDLFTPSNAVAALDMAEKHLLGPLGMKTLDNSDWTYNGDYVNSDDSDNYNTARGFNYHNGPEWLWPVGYFMRARVIMAARLESDKPGILNKATRQVENGLSSHHHALLSSDWRSLPELTNSNGKSVRCTNTYHIYVGVHRIASGPLQRRTPTSECFITTPTHTDVERVLQNLSDTHITSASVYIGVLQNHSDDAHRRGRVCNDSCPAQAWSISCIMDVLYDINVLRANTSV